MSNSNTIQAQHNLQDKRGGKEEFEKKLYKEASEKVFLTNGKFSAKKVQSIR